MARPLLDCAVQRMDPKLLQAVAQNLDIDPSRFEPDATPLSPSEIVDYSNKFQNAIAVPNCAGPEHDAITGWCTIGLTEAECNSASPHDWQTALKWIENTHTDKDTVPGYCKKKHNFANVGSQSFHIHAHTENPDQVCSDMFDALGGFCAVDSWPIPNDETTCTNAGGNWQTFSGKAKKWYPLASAMTEVFDPDTERFNRVTVEGDPVKCEMESSCNWDPNNGFAGGNKTLCLDPSLISDNNKKSRIEDLVDSDGDKATCMRCYGASCEEFHDAAPAICAVRPHSDRSASSSGQTGGGPDDLDKVQLCTGNDWSPERCVGAALSANQRAQCMGYGKACTSPFNRHEIFGGITVEAKCDQCGYRFQPKKKWKSGTWSASSEIPLKFAKRAYEKLNSWDTGAPDREKFNELIRNGVAKLIANAQQDKIMCQMSPYEAWIPEIIRKCNAQDSSSGKTVVQYPLATADMPCNAIGSQQPSVSFEATVIYSDASCVDNSATFQSVAVEKTNVIEDAVTGGRRLSNSNQSCAIHRVIRNSAGAFVGQTIGPGVKVAGVSGATICLNPSVPDAERCSAYTIKDVVSVSST
eukprot:g4374.t1